ncbi:MAG: DNA alkylation repair protein [Cytophagales bacterium]|nr:DNA alkylation repair protein [Cytophagales bacterium]
MHDIIQKVRTQLKESIDEKTQASGKRFFKDKINAYGVKMPVVEKIAKGCLRELSVLGKQEVFELAECLWRSGNLEESIVACNWVYSRRKDYHPGDFAIFQKWIGSYVNNWASCDTFCNHSVGTLVEMFPELLDELEKLASSDNRWMKRAASVTLIVPARRGLFFSAVLKTASKLLLDKDDLVQKGYGWLLKVASQQHQEEVFEFVMNNKAIMPRTALRYAIEKMPKEKKLLAMAK